MCSRSAWANCGINIPLYFSAGSRFWQGGSFEVTKNTSSAGETTDGAVASKSTLEVVIPSELDGSAYVQVEVRSVPGKQLIYSTHQP